MPILLFGAHVEHKYLELQKKATEINRMTKSSSEIRYELQQLLVGQPQAIDAIMPFVTLYSAGFNPHRRPVGVVLMLGPTGVGKTELVESLAETIHCDRSKMIKVNCGEYGADHQVFRILGSPPSYLGAEIKPIFTDKKMAAIQSDHSNLQIILFDEIEKAADSLFRALLNMFDKGSISLGDNTTVDFSNALILMTSNLGGAEIQRAMNPSWGLSKMTGPGSPNVNRMQGMGVAAAKKRFTPEFYNRIDSTVMFYPLDETSHRAILDHIINDFAKLRYLRMGPLRNFALRVTKEACDEIIKRGISQEYGARELKRTFQRVCITPLAEMVEDGKINPLAAVTMDFDTDFSFQIEG